MESNIKIKEIREIKDINNAIIDLDIKNKTLSITFSNIYELIISVYRTDFCNINLHVIAENNENISLLDVQNRIVNDEVLNLCIEFNYIFCGIDTDSEKIEDINKCAIIFDSNNILISNKCFEHNNYEITLKSDAIEIISKKHPNNNHNYFYEFSKIYELLCLIIGYFPKIKKIELYKDNNVISEYTNLLYHYYSSNDIIKRKFSLADINDISNFEDVIDLWEKLDKEVGRYPILGLFVSQMMDTHYSEYKLVILLQSINGYCDVKIKNKLPQKSDKNKKIIKIITDMVKSCDEIPEKKKICKYIEDYHNPNFRDKLKYLMEKGYLSEEVFFEENWLEKNKKKLKDMCELYVAKNSYLDKIVEVRNMISHMTAKKDKFNNFQIRIAYYKWFLLYRIMIIQELGLDINDKRVMWCIKDIQNIGQNSEICNKCEYKAKCVIDYRNEKI